MMHVAYKDGVVVGVFRCPQPDAVDEDGNVIAAGVPTVELPSDHPDIVAYLERVAVS